MKKDDEDNKKIIRPWAFNIQSHELYDSNPASYLRDLETGTLQKPQHIICWPINENLSEPMQEYVEQLVSTNDYTIIRTENANYLWPANRDFQITEIEQVQQLDQQNLQPVQTIQSLTLDLEQTVRTHLLTDIDSVMTQYEQHAKKLHANHLINAQQLENTLYAIVTAGFANKDISPVSNLLILRRLDELRFSNNTVNSFNGRFSQMTESNHNWGAIL